jgi:hypothetical protein
VLTLLVVPTLYALWFRVKENESEPADLTADKATDAFGPEMAPYRIAAE